MREDQNSGSTGEIYEEMEAVLRARHATAVCDTVGPRNTSGRYSGLIELKEGMFLDTGARVYYDTGHVEWACPESDNAMDATVWDIAGDRELEEAAESAAAGSRILVVKNNVDYTTLATYGCHENYSIPRRLSSLSEQLVAFLVTRTLLCGAGRWGAATEGLDDCMAFQLSQRADFIEEVVSKDTRDNRAILNERDEALADSRLYRRLHLILGDSNLSHWTNLMKLGTTGLVLDAAEQGLLSDAPVWRNPVQVLREVSRDLSCRKSYPLQNRGQATALEIQRWYCQAAERAAASYPPHDGRLIILRLWREALDDLAANPARLNDRADWAIKYRFFDQDVLPSLATNWEELGAWNGIIARTRSVNAPPPGLDPQQWFESRLHPSEFLAIREAVEQRGLGWCDYLRQRRNYFTLRALDVRFHDVSRQYGLFHRQTTRNSLPGITPEAIETARREPPRQTRAWLRGRIIKSGRQSLAALDWDQIYLRDGRKISLPDPFAARESAVEKLFRLPAEDV
jgi:hypothetical protein